MPLATSNSTTYTRNSCAELIVQQGCASTSFCAELTVKARSKASPVYRVSPPSRACERRTRAVTPSVLHPDVLLRDTCNQKRSGGSACSSRGSGLTRSLIMCILFVGCCKQGRHKWCDHIASLLLERHR